MAAISWQEDFTAAAADLSCEEGEGDSSCVFGKLMGIAVVSKVGQCSLLKSTLNDLVFLQWSQVQVLNLAR